MKAVRYRAGGGPPRLGRLEDDHVVDAGPAGFRGFDGSDEAWETITSGAGEQHGLQDVRLLAPSEPQKVIAVGLNYQSHISETSLSRPDEPFGFAIWPNALIGHEQEIVDGDLADIRSCDAVLADFGEPDEGTAMEAWYAHGVGVPVVVLAGGRSPHPWAVYVAAAVCDSLEEAVGALAQVA